MHTSKKNVIITKHGKSRIESRYDKDNRGATKLFKRAKSFGRAPESFSPPFSTYLKRKMKSGCKIKVYNDFIFIYRGKTLITMYEVPDKYKACMNVKDELSDRRKQLQDMSNKDIIKEFISYIRMFEVYTDVMRKSRIVNDGNHMSKLIEIWIDAVTYLELVMYKTCGIEYTRFSESFTKEEAYDVLSSSLKLFEESIKEFDEGFILQSDDSDRIHICGLINDIGSVLWYLYDHSFFVIDRRDEDVERSKNKEVIKQA